MISRFWMMTLAACALFATGARGDETDLKKTLDGLLPGMGAEQGFEQPQQKWQEICWNAGTPGHEADRALACKLMSEKLGPTTPARARIWLLKQLERIGRGECVEAIAPLVTDPDRRVRDAAIRALANNPAPGAGEKLRDALKATGDEALRVAIINALGFRQEESSVDVLARTMLREIDHATIVSATARALGKIGTVPAANALRAALDRTRGETRLQVGDALAKCGESLRARGNRTLARVIGNALFSPDEPARLAGLKLRLRTAGNDAPETILEVLAGGNKLDATVALGYVARVDSAGIGRLAAGLAALPPPAQVALLRALGPRRDRAALPAVVAAASSNDSEVKTAALGALGGVTDASTVPLLVKAIQDGGDAATVARQSLEAVFADGVDEAIVGLMKNTADNGRRAQLIEVLEHRRASAAVPALLVETASDDGNVRRRAIAALANVAGADDVAAMIRGMLRMKDAGERGDAERAIAQVCSRIAGEEQQADPVLAVYGRSSEAEQVVLLTVLGRIGGSKALALVRDAVASSDAKRCDKAIQALCEWPDSTVAEDLAALAESTPTGDQKNRLIQSLVRVVVLPGTRSEDVKLALLVRALKQASRNEERRLVLDRARDVHTFATVRFVAPYLDDPKTAGLACATIVELLHREELRNPKDECDKILDKVIAISKDKSLVERAKSFKSKP
jgi:HEAT repeat protein